MIQVIAILLSLAAIVAELFSVLWGWIILALPSAFLITALLGAKRKKLARIPELSELANDMLQKYGHFYTMPFAARDFSSAASTLMFAGAVVAIVGAFKGFWWGIGIGIVYWFVMGLVARLFNPTNYLVDPAEMVVHEEIVSWISKRRTATHDNT
jgi:hypothetical protein